MFILRDEQPATPPQNSPAPSSGRTGSSLTGSSRTGSSLIGQFDLWDLIIVTVGFSIGFALVHALDVWGLLLALITLPAAGRVVYVKRRLQRAGVIFTWSDALLAYAGAVLVMLVAVAVAAWVGILFGLVAMAVVGIVMYVVGFATSISAGGVVYAVAMAIGVCAAVVALIAVPRFAWRRWDQQLADRKNLHIATTTASQPIVAEPVVATEIAPAKKLPGRKRQKYDGNPRRF